MKVSFYFVLIFVAALFVARVDAFWGVLAGGIIGGALSGIGSFFGGRSVARAGERALNNGAGQLAEAALKAADLHSKQIARAMIESMDKLDLTISANTNTMMDRFDFTVSANTDKIIEKLNVNFQEGLQLLSQESSAWKNVIEGAAHEWNNTVYFGCIVLSTAVFGSFTIMAFLAFAGLLPLWLMPEEREQLKQQIRAFCDRPFPEHISIAALKKLALYMMTAYLLCYIINWAEIVSTNQELVDVSLRGVTYSLQRVVASQRSLVPVPTGTILAYNYHFDKPQQKVTIAKQMLQAGWAVCDGTTPSSQGIDNAVLPGPTPKLNDGRYMKGLSISALDALDKTTGRYLEATTLSMDIAPSKMGEYTHDPFTVPVDGSSSQPPDKKGTFTGHWDASGHGAGALRANWTRPNPEPKNYGVVYIILVK